MFSLSRRAFVMHYCFFMSQQKLPLLTPTKSCVLHLFLVPPNSRPCNKHFISLVFSIYIVNLVSSFFSIDLWPMHFMLGP